MSRDRGNTDRGRRRGAAALAVAQRPSLREMSRGQRERLQTRLLIGVVGAISLVAASVVSTGAIRELVVYPNEGVAFVGGDKLSLRTFTDALADDMRGLQQSVAQGSNNLQDPNAAGGQVQKLIDSQEKLPEEVLDKQIEKLVIRKEAARRGIIIPPADIDTKINELLSIQRDVLNQPTATPTPTPSPRPSATEVPEGFEPSPTPTITPTLDPQTPTPTLTPSPTLDPLTPTVTRTPFPTRPTATAIATATIPPTMTGDEFNKAYSDVKPLLKSESNYRDTVAYQLERERLRKAIGASAPESGPRAHVLRLATSTRDEARVALIQLDQDFPFEELSAQASERPAEGRVSGDLGYVARGAEAPEFDDVVFNPDTPLDRWIEPFPAGVHWETVRILERDVGPYDGKNIEKIRDRMFQDWLDQAKQSPEIERDLSPQERQWAVDRASKGIFETTTDRRPGPSRRTP